MQMYDTESRRRSNIEKWLTLGMMERVEQVRNAAEFLTANMEEISDQLNDLESVLEALSGATEDIQDKIEEMMYLIQDEILPDPTREKAEGYSHGAELPF